MARLYPPITEEVLSAFCLNCDRKGNKISASINVDFNLNRAVANAEITGLALRLRTISTNKYVITENLNENISTGKSEGIAVSYNLEDGKATFFITNEQNSDAMKLLKIGQYYRIQLAFIDTTNTIGYWSNIATIKCVAKPSVTIANFNASDANIFSNEIVGEYIQDTSTGDSSEKVYSYSFQLYDKDGNILDETGTQLHNSSADTRSNASTDVFTSYKELDENEFYYVVYNVTTINGLKISSPMYQVIAAESINPQDDIALIVSNGLEENFYEKQNNIIWAPWEEGLIKIYPDLNDNITQGGIYKTITGNFVILRASSKDNFKTWQEIRRFRLKNEIPYTKVIYDYTVEQGITYRYAIQQYNRQQFYSKKIYAYKRDPNTGEILENNGVKIFNDIKADFEDMFLYDGTRQLKIRFNPKVNSFKNSLQEQKIDTIGSKHPFIFRNGNICYKEFPISGLISFQQDNARLFITNEDYTQMALNRFNHDNDIRDINNYQPFYVQVLTKEEINACIKSNVDLYLYAYDEKNNISMHETNNDLQNNIKIKKVYEKINNSQDVLYYFQHGYAIYKKQIGITDSITGNRINTNYTALSSSTKTDLVSENIMSERYFKLLVLDWLTDGKPKLFRSPTEGNYIVRLLNVNLTPKTEIGRMIHEFNCTAYEVADFDYNSLKELGLLKIQAPDETEVQYFSKNIKDILSSENTNGWYVLESLENKEIINFELTNFAPGDKISVTTEDAALPIEITIGTSGSYIYKGGKKVINISFMPVNNLSQDFDRTITITSQGYTSQQFDTIASTSIETKKGEQIVGPRNYFLYQRTVGSGSYYSSPNVKLTADEDSTKLRILEILYLHAKKREIIPIFYNAKSSQTGRSCIEGNTINPPTFSLTPFGQGYIRGKSIIAKSSTTNPGGVTWAGLGNLTTAELTEARTIQDLTDFVITKCNKDIFCLFEVYLPNNGENNGKATDWIPYSSIEWDSDSVDWGAKIYGIYDPWLYEWQRQRITPANQKKCFYLMGWWQRSPLTLNVLDSNNTVKTITINSPVSDYGQYNSSLTFKYKDGNRIITLSNENNEISLKNIEVPQYINIGNGIVMEPIYRIQTIDYTIENENPTLKKLKNKYLIQKQKSEENIKKYYQQKQAKAFGELLTNKYTAELLKIQDYENYISVIENLTQEAQNMQIQNLKTYFIGEKNLIASILNQLQLLDFDLLESLDTLYTANTNERIYDPDGQLVKAKEAYDAFFNNTNKFNSDKVTPKLYGINENQTIQVRTNQINNLIKHITRSSQYNFNDIISNIISNFSGHITLVDEFMNSLNGKIYVAQFLELLEQQAHNILLRDIHNNSHLDPDNQFIFNLSQLQGNYSNISSLTNANPNIYTLIFKKSLTSNTISTLNILSPDWSKYFHFNQEYRLQPLTSDYESFDVSILDNYENSSSPYFISANSYLRNKLNLITNIRTAYNNIFTNGGTSKPKDELITEYNNRYSPVIFDTNNPNINSTSVKAYQLGIVESNTTIDLSSHVLENLINNLYLTNPDISVNEIINNLKQRALIYSLPTIFQTKIISYIENYITSGARDTYVQILACDAYRTEHKQELTEDQLNVIKNTIISLQNETNYKTFMSTTAYKWTVALTANQTSFGYLFAKWQRDYNNIINADHNQIYKTIFQNYINDFNLIINFYNSILDYFTYLQDKYTSINNAYSPSDNIREILWEERERYNYTKKSLEQILLTYNQQKDNLQKDVFFQAYIDFMTSYQEYKNNELTYTKDKEAWLQLVADAEAMTQTEVDENLNPYRQNSKVNAAWKNYLDKLKEIYEIEIEGRFG